MAHPPDVYAIKNYDERVLVLEDDWTPLPWASPMSRKSLVERLQRAAVAELFDPEPEDMLDSGSEQMGL